MSGISCFSKVFIRVGKRGALTPRCEVRLGCIPQRGRQQEEQRRQMELFVEITFISSSALNFATCSSQSNDQRSTAGVEGAVLNVSKTNGGFLVGVLFCWDHS